MATLQLHPRVANLKPSATLGVKAKAKEIRDQGHDVVDLSAGEPDFGTPQCIIDAAKRALDEGATRYTPVRGTDALIQASRKKIKRDQGVNYDASEIIHAVGAKAAIATALECLVGPGDEVIIFSPYWVSYPVQIELTGATPVVVEGARENDYLPQMKDLDAAITERTKMIIINTPTNPTGVVWPEALLRDLAARAKEHDLWVLSDEIYEHLVFDAEPHFSVASLMKTCVPERWSQAFRVRHDQMAGWHHGRSAQVIAAVSKFQSQRYTCGGRCPNGCRLCFDESPELKAEMAGMRATFRQRRDLFMDLVQQTEGVTAVRPEGAFYALVDVSHYCGQPGLEDDVAFATQLLEKAHVAGVPGSAFGAPGTLRFSLASSEANLRAGFEGLKRFTQSLP